MIKILRLVTGEDIISNMVIVEEVYELTKPMEVDFSNGNRNAAPTVILSWWLPVPVLKENVAYICEKDILAVMEPSSDILEYYTKSAMDQSSFGSNPGPGLDLTEEDRNLILDQVPVGPNGLH